MRLIIVTYAAHEKMVIACDLRVWSFLTIPVTYHTRSNAGYAKTNTSAKIGTSLTNTGELNVAVLSMWMSDCHRWGSIRFIGVEDLVKLEKLEDLTNRAYIYISL